MPVKVIKDYKFRREMAVLSWICLTFALQIQAMRLLTI